MEKKYLGIGPVQLRRLKHPGEGESLALAPDGPGLDVVTLGHVKREVVMARKLITNHWAMCHRRYAQSYAKEAGYYFGRQPGQLNPDEMLDHVKESPDWIQVYVCEKEKAEIPLGNPNEGEA